MTTWIHPRLWLALGLLLAGAGLSVVAWQGPADAMLIPRVVLAIWSVMALILVVTELVKRAPAVKLTRSPLPVLMLVLMAAAIATASLGFLIPALVSVALTLWLFRIRRPLPLFLGTLLIGAGLWFLFHHVLLIRLPSLLTNGVI